MSSFPYTGYVFADGVPNDVSAARLNNMQEGIGKAGVKGVASSPPGSPADGDIWLPTPQTGVYQMFVYNSALATYKWVFVGGGPMYDQSDTDGSFSSTSYVDPTTAPSMDITVSRAGIYRAHWGARLQIATDNFHIECTVKIGAAAGSDDNAASNETRNATGRIMVVERSKIITAAASDLLKIQYKGSAASGVDIREQWFYVWPIQVI